MSAAETPTPQQQQCAGALLSLLRSGVAYTDALALIRLIALDGNTERTKTVGAFLMSGIPYEEAERYAANPGMREALLAEIKRAQRP